MKKDSKFHVCRFDVVLLLVVLIFGAAAWLLIHGNSDEKAYRITSEQLVEELLSNPDNSTIKDEVEYYNIDYTVFITGSSLEPSTLPEVGAELCDTYSGCEVGTLQDCTWNENADGTIDIELTIREYAAFTRLKVTTPAGTLLRIGAPLTLSKDDQSYVGSGTITWISH